MFYHNTKYKFALWDGSPISIAGGIIAASAMAQGQLLRRDIRKQRYLQHRLFDPQLYMAGLDPNTSSKSVVKLASWPWFGETGVPQYDSDRHGSLAAWKSEHEQDLLQAWLGRPPGTADAICAAARAAVAHQVEFGCEAVLLPSPLTNVASQGYEVETLWLDAGIQACEELQVAVPVFATVAVSDNVLRGIEATQNPLLHTITNQIAARARLAGAYVVVEQASEDSYVCSVRDTLLSVLILVDDLVRGAARRAIVNYMGTFGAVGTAAGGSIWSSGYYLSQRRFRLSDSEDKIARAYPRFYSRRLIGDVELENDILAVQRSNLAPSVLDETASSHSLLAALRAGNYPGAVPEWQGVSNLAAAGAHYNEVCFNIGADLSSLGRDVRVDIVHRWLRGAVELADRLWDSGIRVPHRTDVHHQRTWLQVFEGWRNYARL